MPKRLLCSLLLLFALASRGQECTSISFPVDGTSNVPVDATITWPSVEGANGYLISLGTTSGAGDILNRHALGQLNSYKAPTGLPENTLIYVTLSILQFNTQPKECSIISFTTMNVTTAPPCTFLIAPDNNAAYVTITTDIVWAYSPTATNYTLSLGTSPGQGDILDNHNVGNVLSYDPPVDLPQSTWIYVSIIPSNENGSIQPCTEELFFTGSAFNVCDPHVDELTGEMIDLRPKINFPNRVGICSTELPYVVRTEDTAQGFRWFQTNPEGTETLVAEGRSFPIVEPGRYILEAYNTVVRSGIPLECSSTHLFTVATSETAEIESIHSELMPGGKRLTVYVSGIGSYEFALDNVEGPFQESSIFENVREGEHTVYVRDKKGCGISERTVDRNLSNEDFPKFFTPNADGINDFWQYIPPEENFEVTLENIDIFDQYGHFLTQLNPQTEGWDGNFRGQPMPSSDYWFKAVFTDQRGVRGHFSLKR